MMGRSFYPGHGTQLHMHWCRNKDRNGNVWLVQGEIESVDMAAQAWIGLCCSETQAKKLNLQV